MTTNELDLMRPRAAACPKLPALGATELFLAAGFDAVAGFPLPDGTLPVFVALYGVILVPSLDWEVYCNLCYAESLGALVGAH